LLVEAEHGDYVFAHALVRQTIYRQLGSARRMRLHRQLGDAIEAIGDADAHVEVLTYHFAQAAADGQGVKAADYALVAGRRATARLGHEEAAAHYERGLEALALSGQPQAERRCELLLALGKARWDAGEIDKARQAYECAAGLAEQLGNATALARAALGFCGPHRGEVTEGVTRPVAVLLQRALAALDEEDGALRAQVMGRLGAVLAYTGIEQGKPVLARKALEMARVVADKATLADVLASALWATRSPDSVHEAVALAQELGRVAHEVGDRRLQAMAHVRLLDHRLELGDIEAVERGVEALQGLGDPRKERYLRWVLAIVRARQVLMAGRLADYETLAHEAFAHGYEGHDEAARQVFDAQMLVVRSIHGRHDELLQTVESLVAQYPQIIGCRCLLASVYVRLERWAQARQQFEALAHRDFEDLPRDASWLSNLVTLSEVAASLSDVRRAQLLYALLLPYDDRCVLAGAVLCQGPAARPLGLLAATQSRFEDAERHFEQALKMNAQIRSRLGTAQTQCDYAQMLLLRSHRHDNDKALDLLTAALATAEQLGLQALDDRARPLKLAAEAAGPPPVVPSTA
ncbi:MAG TPA: hypothetical protein VGH21_06940, partial [Solirubrobacteraceae bacterium]